jgi:cytochrome c-type biogenesis protein CcmH/NrfF
VGNLYGRRGQQKPVTAVTALWFFPGILILVGPFIWFVQTNNALNDYWRSVGAQGTTLV